MSHPDRYKLGTISYKLLTIKKGYINYVYLKGGFGRNRKEAYTQEAVGDFV